MCIRDRILTLLEQKSSAAFPAPPDVTAQVKYVPNAMEPYLSPAFYMIPVSYTHLTEATPAVTSSPVI